jgi:hypothetical protein
MSFLGMNMARRANRQWLVALTYLGLAAVGVLALTQVERGGVMVIVMATLVNGFILGGYGRWGLIQPFGDCSPLGSAMGWLNDERDLHRRDRAHFYAYRFVLAILLFGWVLAGKPFQDPRASQILMLGGIVLGLTLPQALLLWIEPDMEFDEGDDPDGLARQR